MLCSDVFFLLFWSGRCGMTQMNWLRRRSVLSHQLMVWLAVSFHFWFDVWVDFYLFCSYTLDPFCFKPPSRGQLYEPLIGGARRGRDNDTSSRATYVSMATACGVDDPKMADEENPSVSAQPKRVVLCWAAQKRPPVVWVCLSTSSYNVQFQGLWRHFNDSHADQLMLSWLAHS